MLADSNAVDEPTDAIYPSNEFPSTFHQLLAGLEAEHRREMEEVRRSYEIQVETLHARLKSPELESHEQTKHFANGDDDAEKQHTAKLQAAEKSEPAGGDSPGKAAGRKKNRANSSESVSFESGTLLKHVVSQHLGSAERKQRDRRAQILDAHIKKVGDRFKKKEQGPGQRQVARFVHSAYFDAFCVTMIFINSLVLGISTDLDFPSEDGLPKYAERQAVFKAIDHFFSAWFIIEILLRGLAEGIGGFCFFSSNTRWNIFDSIIVGVDICDIVFLSQTDGNLSDAGASITILRVFRIFRVARAVRVIRLVKFFTELRLMVLSIMKSGLSLLWTMTLLLIIMYIFGILIMSIVSSYLTETADVSNRGELTKWFGSLPRIIYTLFLCISGGISWVEISEPLIKIHWSNGFIISFFIFFTVFSMLNIITGIFVESTMSSVQNDKDEVVREHLTNEKGILRRLEDIFHKADTKQVGSITIQDFEEMMQVPETHALMSTLGLDVNEARGMFNLMDTSRSGHVGIEEFLIGCIRMKGGAKAVDLVTLMFENKKLVDTLSNFVEYVEEEFTRSQVTEASTLSELKLMKRAMHPQRPQHSPTMETI